MANHKSAIKRNRQNQKRRARNRHVKSTMRGIIQTLNIALSKNDVETAESQLPLAVRALNRAASKNVIPKARASRKISRLTVAVNKLKAAA